MDPKVYQEKYAKCNEFLERLSELLQDTYEPLKSCNEDLSWYLVPKGTKDQVTYYGKPVSSFRVSDHWNWFSSTKKCKDENYVQCRSLDMPWARHREEKGKATKPRFGIQVCIQGIDGCYHHVFGDKFDRKKRIWEWVECSPESVLEVI